MVYHVNDHVASIATLLYTYDTLLDEIERGQEMLARVSAMDPNATVPNDVVEFINQYISEEVLIEVGVGGAIKGTISIIGKILGGLKKAIVKIMEIIQEVFRILFDSQYRHRREFVNINKSLLMLSINTEAIARYEATPCAILAQSKAIDAIMHNKHLINLVRFATECDTNDGVDDLLKTFGSIGQVRMVNNQLVDLLGEVYGEHFKSFKEAGWSLTGLQEVIGKHIDCINAIEVLKETEKKIKGEISKLDYEVTEAMHANRSSEYIHDLQKRIAIKTRVVRIIGGAIEIVVKRSAAISNIIRALHDQIKKSAEA